MEKIFITSDGVTLAGNLCLPQHIANPSGLLILHGAGNGNKERFMQLQITLEKIGIASLAIDFRGVGESSSAFTEGSLHNRTVDAQYALKELVKYCNPKKIAVFGSSMGGYIASLIAHANHTAAVILSSSAAYSPEAEDKPLNEAFTKILTQPNSWEKSKSFTALKEFSGDALVLYGENDTVIPDDIKRRYKESLKGKVNSMFVIIPRGTHRLLIADTLKEKKIQATALKTITDFLTKSLQGEF